MTISFNISILIREVGKHSGKLTPAERFEGFGIAKAKLQKWVEEDSIPESLMAITMKDLEIDPNDEGSPVLRRVAKLVAKYSDQLPGGLKNALVNKERDQEQQLADGCVFIPTPPTPPPPVGYWDCGGSALMLDVELGLVKADGKWVEVPVDRAEVTFGFGISVTPVALVPKVL